MNVHEKRPRRGTTQEGRQAPPGRRLHLTSSAARSTMQQEDVMPKRRPVVCATLEVRSVDERTRKEKIRVDFPKQSSPCATISKYDDAQIGAPGTRTLATSSPVPMPGRFRDYARSISRTVIIEYIFAPRSVYCTKRRAGCLSNWGCLAGRPTAIRCTSRAGGRAVGRRRLPKSSPTLPCRPCCCT